MSPCPLPARLTLALLVAALTVVQATPSLASRAWPLNDGRQTHQRVADQTLAEFSTRFRAAAPDPVPSPRIYDRHLRLLRAEIPLALAYDLGLTPAWRPGFLSTFTYDPPPPPPTCITDGLGHACARGYDPGNVPWLCADPLGPVDSPNLYQAFGLDPQNNTDPLGLRVPNAQDKRIRQRLVARLEELDRQWSTTGSAGATVMDTEARPQCLLCTENEYVPVARERSASTETEYQELRTRLAREVTDFDAAVAKADKDDVIHFRGGGLQGEGPYYTVFTKIDAVSNAEAMAWFNVGASEQVAANVAYMTRLIDARNPIVVEPVGVPGSAVGPGERASYGELKARKRAFGETEPLHMDHQPSFAAQVRAREALLGRPLTKSELAALKLSTPAAASPQAVHQETSLTYGGRNTPERIAEDAADLAAAAARDREVFEHAMRARAR